MIDQPKTCWNVAIWRLKEVLEPGGGETRSNSTPLTDIDRRRPLDAATLRHAGDNVSHLQFLRYTVAQKLSTL